MTWSALLSRIAAIFRRQQLDHEFDAEVRLHLELLAERFIAQGMSPQEASTAARRQFGGVTPLQQELRERRSLLSIHALARDFRHAFGQLRHSRRFAFAAALTLALGIGASTAVFAVFDAVVLRPLPYADPGRLMAFRSLDRRAGGQPGLLSYPDFFDYRARNSVMEPRVFEHLISYRDAGFTLTDSQPPIQVPGLIVAWELFPMLGVQPALGRGFLPEEEKPGTHVVVLSHSLWQGRFTADAGIVGHAISINGTPFTVVGVAPAGFQFPADTPGAALWVTLAEDAAALNQRGGRMLDAIGRLKPGVSPAQAQAQMDLAARALAQQYPDSHYGGTLVMPELERVAGGSVKPLLVLLAAVAMLLLIACANVANLLLARNAERTREFALRTALGASRAAIAAQMLIESLALALVAAAGGVLLAWGALRFVLPLAANNLPRVTQAGIDIRVLAFSIAMAVLTTVLFSLAPAFQAAGADPAGALKEGAQNIARGHDRFRGALVVVQITLGLVLLVAAELLIAGFLQLVQRDPGFRADHLLTFNLGLPETQYDGAHKIAFCDHLLERLRAIPGVQAAAAGHPLPLQGHEMRSGFDIEGRPVPSAERPRSDFATVTPGYFAAMGIPLLKGRDFSERDDANTAPVLVVNQAFARKFFPGEDVVGKRIHPGAGAPATGTAGSAATAPAMREIVGVVGDARQAPLGVDSDPIFYFPWKQLPWGIGTLVLRTSIPPGDAEAAARAAVADLAAMVPVHQVRTGEDLSAAVLARMQFLIVLMGSFAAIALLLTVAGLYGVLSYAVARRRREIGVRIALGASHTEVLALIFRHALRLVAAGLVLGLAGATAAARLLGTLVFGVRPGDPLLLALACGVILLTSAAAAYIPAARAAAVDPMLALRSE